MRYDVRYTCEFSPGDVDGSTETAPADLIGDDGRIMFLAAWPQTGAFVTEAEDETEAVSRAADARAGAIHINSKIPPDRFWELAARPRPGSSDHYSVVGIWRVREVGSSSWHLGGIDHPIRRGRDAS
jgi:hypothetical protein